MHYQKETKFAHIKTFEEQQAEQQKKLDEKTSFRKVP